MQTIKLYDTDSHLKEFTATVLSCEKTGEIYKTVLDKTAFFPEGGGQPSDTGYLNGVRVSEVKEENGEIYHFSAEGFKKGEKVNGKIDFERRFSFMQNHSGEHIVSGIVNRKYGFDNVGFHLNEHFCTLDFNGELTAEQLNEIENEANEIIYENRRIRAYYPTKEELKNINYRSKKEIEGDTRIVEIEGVDICACCAPHVKKTGEIGIIKLLEKSKMRGGIRIVLKCGRYALNDFKQCFLNTSKISESLSVKRENTAAAVENLLKKQDNIKQKTNELTRRFIEASVKTSSPDKNLFYEKDFDMRELQIFADGLHKAHSGVKAVFAGNGENLNFAACGDEQELNLFFARLKENFSVRGGGRNGMISGSINAEFSDLEKIIGCE